jgi:hypothetical protein
MLSHKKARGSIPKGVKKLAVPLPDRGRGKKNHNFFGSKKPPHLEFYSKVHKSIKIEKKRENPVSGGMNQALSLVRG